MKINKLTFEGGEFLKEPEVLSSLPAKIALLVSMAVASACSDDVSLMNGAITDGDVVEGEPGICKIIKEGESPLCDELSEFRGTNLIFSSDYPLSKFSDGKPLHGVAPSSYSYACLPDNSTVEIRGNGEILTICADLAKKAQGALVKCSFGNEKQIVRLTPDNPSGFVDFESSKPQIIKCSIKTD